MSVMKPMTRFPLGFWGTIITTKHLPVHHVWCAYSTRAALLAIRHNPEVLKGNSLGSRRRHKYGAFGIQQCFLYEMKRCCTLLDMIMHHSREVHSPLRGQWIEHVLSWVNRLRNFQNQLKNNILIYGTSLNFISKEIHQFPSISSEEQKCSVLVLFFFISCSA